MTDGVSHYKRRIVDNYKRLYADLSGLNYEPILALTPEEVLKFVIPPRADLEKVIGVAYDVEGILYVNLKQHLKPNGRLNMKELKDTIAHEIVHLAFLTARHGKSFDKKVAMLVAGKAISNFN